MPQSSKIETRRANRFYVFTGPADLIRVATIEELRATLREMKKRRHVNVAIVAHEIEERETRAPRAALTLAELRYLSEAGIGVSMDRFLRTIGVTRRYDYEPASAPRPAVVRRPAGSVGPA